MNKLTIERKTLALHNFAQRALEAGQDEKAIGFFEQALALTVFNRESYLAYADLLHRSHRYEKLIDVCEQGLQLDNNITTLQKYAINALINLHGIEAAFDYYRLKRVDSRPLSFADDAILCCSVIRNEYPRLPYFLDYYRRLGIERFFFVDNGSSDGSAEFLLAQPDVYLWSSDMAFGRASYGSAWFELLLQRYGTGHWWMMVDADELVVYADSETRSLQSLCQMLEQNNRRAASGLMVDLYAKQTIQDTVYPVGSDFFESCGFFDRWQTLRIRALSSFAKTQDFIHGGARNRVFPTHNEYNYVISKTPLLFYDKNTLLEAGQHATNAPTEQVAHDILCVAHFKFFASFIDYAHQEAVREQHASGAIEYKAYVREIAEHGAVSLYDEQFSICYENTAQLHALGFLQAEPGDYQASAWTQQLHPSNKCSPK